MKHSITCLILLVINQTSLFACPFCNRDIMNGIYNSTFYPNLLTMLSAFVVLAAIVFVLVIVSTRRYKKLLANYQGGRLRSPVPLTTASLILGIGLGGFLDGILLHQVFQVHEMLSNKIPATDYVGKSVNMFWDGVFHLFCLLVVLTGVILLWKVARTKRIDKSGNLLAGGLLMGWALFNIVEGIIDHQLLKLHNVIELSPDHSLGNYGFLVISFVMLLIGMLISKRKPALNAQSNVQA